MKNSGKTAGNLASWEDNRTEGDHPYDFLIQDSIGAIRIQVKMQRQKNQRPMTAKEGYRIFSAEKWDPEGAKGAVRQLGNFFYFQSV